MQATVREWYDTNPDWTSFYQGDIVRDVPLIFLPDNTSTWFVLRPSATGKQADNILRGQFSRWLESFPQSQLPDAWANDGKEELVAARAVISEAIILTQTCDLVQREYYQVAPLYPETVHEASDLHNLRKNKLNYKFYLPAMPPYLSVSRYADLPQTCLVPKAYFPAESVAQRLTARLTDWARTALQEKLAKYFGRPFGFDGSDRSRETAEHCCASCFYLTGESVKETFQAGANYTKCQKCGTARWIRPVQSKSVAA